MMNTDLAGYLLWLPAGLAALGVGLLTLGLGRWGCTSPSLDPQAPLAHFTTVYFFPAND